MLRPKRLSQFKAQNSTGSGATQQFKPCTTPQPDRVSDYSYQDKNWQQPPPHTTPNTTTTSTTRTTHTAGIRCGQRCEEADAQHHNITDSTTTTNNPLDAVNAAEQPQTLQSLRCDSENNNVTQLPPFLPKPCSIYSQDPANPQPEGSQALTNSEALSVDKH